VKRKGRKKQKKGKRPPIHILATPLYRSSGVWVLKIIIIRGSSYLTSIRRCRQTSRPRIQFCHVRRCHVRSCLHVGVRHTVRSCLNVGVRHVGHVRSCLHVGVRHTVRSCLNVGVRHVGHVRSCHVRCDVFDERCHSSESPRPEDTPPSTSTASLSHCHDPRW